MIALRRKPSIEDLASVLCGQLKTVKTKQRSYHPPKDVDQEVGEKLEGSIEKIERGS